MDAGSLNGTYINRNTGRIDGANQRRRDSDGQVPNKLVPISSLTPEGIRNHRKWILRRIYRGERSALMHAKKGEDYLVASR